MRKALVGGACHGTLPRSWWKHQRQSQHSQVYSHEPGFSTLNGTDLNVLYKPVVFSGFQLRFQQGSRSKMGMPWFLGNGFPGLATTVRTMLGPSASPPDLCADDQLLGFTAEDVGTLRRKPVEHLTTFGCCSVRPIFYDLDPCGGRNMDVFPPPFVW